MPSAKVNCAWKGGISIPAIQIGEKVVGPYAFSLGDNVVDDAGCASTKSSRRTSLLQCSLARVDFFRSRKNRSLQFQRTLAEACAKKSDSDGMTESEFCVIRPESEQVACSNPGAGQRPLSGHAALFVDPCTYSSA